MYKHFHTELSPGIHSIHSYSQAIRFLYYLELRPPTGIQRIPIKLSHQKHKFSGHAYLPHKNNGKTILVVHGMSLLAHEDQRYVKLCQTIAKLGFTAVIPHYPSIQNLEISPKQFDQVAASIQAIHKSKDLCPSGRLSLLSNSFSSLIAITAGCHKDTANLVSSILVTGTPMGFSFIKHVLGDKDSDPYGMWIMLMNYLPYIMDLKKSLKKAMFLEVEDNFYSRSDEESHLKVYLQTLNKKERNFVLKLKNNFDFRHQILARILKQEKKMKGMAFSLTNCLDHLQAPISLIHGKNDKVIPAQESINIARILKERSLPHHLYVSQLISHGKPSFHIGLIADLFPLLGALRHFFRHI